MIYYHAEHLHQNHCIIIQVEIQQARLFASLPAQQLTHCTEHLAHYKQGKMWLDNSESRTMLIIRSISSCAPACACANS